MVIFLARPVARFCSAQVDLYGQLAFEPKKLSPQLGQLFLFRIPLDACVHLLIGISHKWRQRIKLVDVAVNLFEGQLLGEIRPRIGMTGFHPVLPELTGRLPAANSDP